MARSTTKELTSGSPMKLILGFAVPLLFGMLFQQFYSLMDTIIVGRYLGVTALAAVGATGSINFSDHRILSGNLQRFRSAGCPAVRCARL